MKTIIHYAQQFVIASCEGFCLAMALILGVILFGLFIVNIQMVIATFIVGSLFAIALMGANMKWE